MPVAAAAAAAVANAAKHKNKAGKYRMFVLLMNYDFDISESRHVSRCPWQRPLAIPLCWPSKIRVKQAST